MTWTKKEDLSDQSMDSRILAYIKNRESMMTPVELGKVIREKTGYDKRKIKSLIFNLVSNGDLEYIDVFGRNVLVLSFSRPVRVSSRVVLKPPDVRFSAQPNDLVVSLNKGIAFGRGTHPTTVLCIQALNWIFDDHSPSVSTGLDIGTGTGVLAVAAAKLGATTILACDIDPVAIHEARENASLNDLEHRITIKETCDFTRTYDLIMANLRYPTLISMQKDMTQSLSQQGWIVLSGIKKDEMEKVNAHYGKHLELIRHETEGGWASLVYKMRS